MSIFSKRIIIVASFLFFGVLSVQVAQAQTDDVDDEENYKHIFKSELLANPDAEIFGEAFLGVHGNEKKIDFTINIDNPTNLTAAYLRCAPISDSAPAIATLFESDNAIDDTLITGTLAEEDVMGNLEYCSPGIETMPHLVQALRENKVYIDVQTTEYPEGYLSRLFTETDEWLEEDDDSDGIDSGDEDQENSNGTNEPGAITSVGSGFGVTQLEGETYGSFARFRYGDDNASTLNPYELAVGIDASDGELYESGAFDHSSGETQNFSLTYDEETSLLTLAIGESESVAQYQGVPIPGDALALTAKITEGSAQSVNVSNLSLSIEGEMIPLEDTSLTITNDDTSRTRYLLIDEVDLHEGFTLEGDVALTYADTTSEETPGLTFELEREPTDDDEQDESGNNSGNDDNLDDLTREELINRLNNLLDQVSNILGELFTRE